jgi:hypothetical protein
MSIKFIGHASSSRPGGAVDGQVIYNTTTSQLEIYTSVSGNWEVVGKTGPWKYRTVITTGYALGGYKSGTPWKNVARMVHSTDTCTNLGDLLSYAGSYTAGNCSLTHAWLYSSDNIHPGYSNQTVSMNMVTETNNSYGGSMNTIVDRGDCAAMFKEHYFGYIASGGNNYTDTHNLTTGTMYSTNQYSGGFTWNDADSSSAWSGEIAGYCWDNTYGRKALFSTDTSLAQFSCQNSGSYWGAHGQQKGICSKVGKGYVGNEGTYSGGYNLRRWQESNDTNIGAVSKPVANCGEENFDMGQDWQYMMGCYDGLQNNRGWKFSYTTDSGPELSGGSLRTGQPGSSSGHGAWKG